MKGEMMNRVAVLFAMIAYSWIEEVRSDLAFASLGNWGGDSKMQREVAYALKSRGHDDKLSLIVSPGSNFMEGVSGVEDPRWNKDFVEVYSDESQALKIPFFTVLGIEDWNGMIDAPVLYTEHHDARLNGPIWSMPNYWYYYSRHFQTSGGGSLFGLTHTDKSVGFVFIDTWILSSHFPFADISQRAWDDLRSTLLNAPKILDYIIVIGDKSLYSSGKSGGDRHLAKSLVPLFQEANIDAYISGYDDDMEILNVEGITYINCGSGSRSDTKYYNNSDSIFFTSSIGYCNHKLTADGFSTMIIGVDSGEEIDHSQGEVDNVDHKEASVLFEHFVPIKTRPDKSKVADLTYYHALPEVKYVPIPPMGRMPTKDAYVSVIGTVGLVIEIIFGGMFIATMLAKNMVK